MRFLRRLLKRVGNFVMRRRNDERLREEIEAHLALQTEVNIKAGMPPAEARRQAALKFGAAESIKQDYRAELGLPFIESVLQDVRFGVRMLRKSPGFTLIAILTLALGIGANTAIFSAVNGILVKPLPYPHSGRIVDIQGRWLAQGPYGPILADGLSFQDFREIQTQCHALKASAAYVWSPATIRGNGFTDNVGAPQVTGNFFTMLGVRPLLGRPILPSDAQPGNDHVAVLSYEVWKTDFGGDRNVVGKSFAMNKAPYTIIGVMPRKFGTGLWRPDVWVPLTPAAGDALDRAGSNFLGVGELRPGVTLAGANAQLKTLAARLAAAYPGRDKGVQFTAKSVKDELVGAAAPVELLILFAAVGLVLLIACVNVSGMLVARSWTRHREVAIRQALGATRRRIIWQFLMESLLLSLAGGALGLLLAVWLVPALRAIAPAGTPRIGNLRLDANVLWFALGVSVLCGILFGLAPAMQSSGDRVGVALKEGIGGLLEGFSARGPRRLRGALVVVEVALAVILATGATLLARSLLNLMDVPLGYRTDRVLIVQPSLDCDYSHPDICRQLTDEILRGVRGISGVESAAAASTSPLAGGFGWPRIEVEEPSGPRTFTPPAIPHERFRPIYFRAVTPDYFRTMGIPLLGGRDFTEGDTSDSQPVAIVNRAFAQEYLGGASVLGRRISMPKPKNNKPVWMEVVGEVGETRDARITQEARPEFYLPETQSGADVTNPAFLVRTVGSPLAMLSVIKQRIRSVDKGAQIGDAQTMSQLVSEEEAGPRFRASLLGAFGVLGVLLAIVGIYGVISYAVSRRTREIGLRMALGAQPSDALGMVIREGMVLAGVGIIIGVGGALALTRLLRSFLFEIQPNDPGTFAAVAGGLAIAALLACWIPARRAMRIDPMSALRNE